MQIVIEIPEEEYNYVKTQVTFGNTNPLKMRIANGTPLPKGHGRLIDADALKMRDISPEAWYSPMRGLEMQDIEDAPTIIEADKEYEVEVITRGNCMMCGKELTEGLFFCKECEAKAESEDAE